MTTTTEEEEGSYDDEKEKKDKYEVSESVRADSVGCRSSMQPTQMT